MLTFWHRCRRRKVSSSLGEIVKVSNLTANGGQDLDTKRLNHSPIDSQSLYHIWKLHWKKSLFSRKKEGQYMKFRYLNLNFLWDIILCFINFLLTFPENVKRIFLYLLYPNEDYNSSHDSPFKLVYHSFEVANAYHYYISDLEQDPNDNHSQSSRSPSQKTTVMATAQYAPLNLQAPVHDLS